MNFLKKIKSSIYDPAFYSEIMNMNLGSSFKYFFKFSLTLTLLSTVYLSFLFVPKAYSFLNTVSDKVVSAYPSELEITIKDGSASTNVTEPYIVPIPQGADTVNNNQAYKNVIVIDTKNDFSIDMFNNYHTAVLVTKNALVSRDQKGKITITELKTIPNIVVNHKNLVSWVNRVTPYVKSIPYAIPVLLFIGIYIYYISSLLYLLIAGFIVFIIGKIRKQGLSYKKSYQISLHAVTLPIILSTVLTVFDVRMFFLLPTIILVIVAWINLKSSKNTSSVV